MTTELTKIKCRTVQEAKDTLALMDNKVFAFDTETTDVVYTKLEITGFSACDGNTAVYFYITDDNRKGMLKAIKDFFKDAGLIIAHNIVFDAKVLDKYDINFEEAMWFDTMIAHHLIDENARHGLKMLTRNILRRDVVEFDEVSANHYTEEFGDYGLADAVNTYDLYKVFLPKLATQKLITLFNEVEMPFQRCLLQMAITGVLIDTSKMERLEVELHQETFKLEAELYDLLKEEKLVVMEDDKIKRVVGVINFNSSKQLAVILFEKLGLDIIEYTPKGAPKTGKEVILHYKDSVPFVATLYKYKIAQKLYSSFISPTGQLMKNLEKDGRVRPYFNDVGTKTGRLSCSSPNLQQLPKPKDYCPANVRELFIAPKGYKMITGDYSGQEVAVMAHQSKDPTLIDALNKGMDMHMVVANTFYKLGIPEEKLFKTHPEFNEVKGKYKKQRTEAKTITFGLAYGKGAYGFAKDFKITEREAEVLVRNYFRGMPKLKQSIDATHRVLERRGTVRNLAGRLRHFKRESNGKYSGGAFRQSFNFLIQGFSADMIRKAMIAVYRLGKENPEWDLKLVMTVHDELNCTIKEEYSSTGAERIKEEMEKATPLCVPTTADLDITDNYAQAK